MLMNFSSKRKAVHATPVFLSGRTGHGAARINDSIFVLGGSEKAGGLVSEVHRINCLNNRIDTLILENTISVEGFSLFSHQEALLLWGGRRLRQHSNLLLQFDGIKFATLKQQGNVPAPRAFHASVTFGGKYLMLFGGSDQLTFFNDWNLLNLKTLQWKTLTPSLELKPSLHCSMVWTNGRGILLLNQIFLPTSASNLPNAFYEFYVSDFNSGRLKLLPLQLTFNNTIFQQYIFRHMIVAQQNSVIIFGGYQLNDPSSLHNHSYVLSFDPLKLEKSKIRYKEKTQFVSVYHKNKLFIIGGILSSQQLESHLEIYENPSDRTHYRRHVCLTCKLYFDQEWFKTSKQAFPRCKIKQEYDYNFHTKIDNRILAKFSNYITKEIYAVSLIIQNLKNMACSHVNITFHKEKQDYSRMIQEMANKTHYFLKIVSDFNNFDANLVISQLLMTKKWEYQSSSLAIPQLQAAILKIKLACLRLGSSSLFSLKVSKDQIFILYFSSSQLQCTHSNLHPFTNYHYYYNTKTKECSSRNNRHIIIQNLKRHNNTSLAQLQQVSNHSLTVLIFCRQQLQSQFLIMQNHEEMETGQTCPVLMSKYDNRKAVSLFQFSFLPQPKLSNIFIQRNPVNFINIIEIVKGDFNSKTIERIYLFDPLISGDIFQKIELFHYPQEYWFRRMLIYHSNRLIMDFQGKLSICGVIILKPTVELDLTGNHISNLQVEEKVRSIMRELRSLKRQTSTF